MPEKKLPTDLPLLRVKDQREWERWLAKHADTSPGVWLELGKKGSGVTTPSYAEALDAALCFGWIDGQKGSKDDEVFLQRFTRRGPKSVWSKINCGHAERLAAAGRMKKAGLAAIEAAKADGRWERAYSGQRVAEVPEDLARELARSPKARKFFETLKGANRYAILYRLQTAKKAETRAARLKKFVEMLERGETLH
jgi:uncharacterized protein YdeI (YjbR/CyaY-like superfamily)